MNAPTTPHPDYKDERPTWCQYLIAVDPETPYLREFMDVATMAYVQLGGDILDESVGSARQAQRQWREDMVARRDDPKHRAIVSSREGTAARRDVDRMGDKRVERWETAYRVADMHFFMLLGEHVLTPAWPWQDPNFKPMPYILKGPPPTPADPEKLQRVQETPINEALRRVAEGRRPEPVERLMPDHMLNTDLFNEDAARQQVAARMAQQKMAVDKREHREKMDFAQRLSEQGMDMDEALTRAGLMPDTKIAPASGAHKMASQMMSMLDGDSETLAALPPERRAEVEKVKAKFEYLLERGVPGEKIAEIVQRVAGATDMTAFPLRE